MALIENGELQGVKIAGDVSELIPFLFGPLEVAPANSHLLYEITVR